MGFQVLRRESHVTMPWANGGGTTREIARSVSVGATGAPAGDGPGFDWRLSFADVEQSGPFSRLPGCDRVITLVSGDALHLRVDGRPHVLRRSATFAFRGEDDVWCAPEGPTVDFNVMTRRDAWTGSVACQVLSGDDEVVRGSNGGAAERFVAVLDGSPGLVGPDGALIALRPYDVVRAGPEPLTLSGVGEVAIVDLAESEARRPRRGAS